VGGAQRARPEEEGSGCVEAEASAREAAVGSGCAALGCREAAPHMGLVVEHHAATAVLRKGFGGHFVAELHRETAVAELHRETAVAELHRETAVAKLRRETAVAELHRETAVAKLRRETEVERRREIAVERRREIAVERRREIAVERRREIAAAPRRELVAGHRPEAQAVVAVGREGWGWPRPVRPRRIRAGILRIESCLRRSTPGTEPACR